MRYFLYIFSFLLSGTIFGQQLDVDFSLIANQNKVLIGNPIQIQLRFDYPSIIDESSIGFPVVSDSTNLGDKFEIWGVTPPVKNSEEDNLGNIRMTFEQNFTVACFDSGRFELGPITAFIGNDTLSSNAVSIIVLPVAVDTEQDFKDIKQLSEDPLTSWERFMIWFKKYWYWPTAILIAIIATVLFMQWKKRKPEKVEVIPTVPLSIRLLEELNKVEKEELWQNNKNKLYYSKLTEVLWKFIEDRYAVATFEKTSGEILNNLKMKAVSKDHFILLEKLFSLSDMVKFAKSLPSPHENEEALNITKNFILETRNDLEKIEKKEVEAITSDNK